MSQLIESSTLRILRPDGKTVGTGFLVSKDLAVTCAHVVVAAEAIDGDTIQVQFTGRDEKLEALVEPKLWRDIDKGDVAFLRLKTVPEGLTPLRLGPAAQSQSGNPCYSFGYATAADIQGIGARGNIITLLPDGSTLQIRAHEADHGISGGPVLDEKRGVVVGMITQGHTKQGRNAETTFATPAELFFEICPEISPSEICPYRGLEAFSEADAHFFHGRKRVIERLLESLKRQPRFLAVLGPSGSGKSSVVQAGLLPALRSGEIIGSETWQFFQTRPGDDPFVRLDSAGLTEAGSGLVAALQKWTQTHPDTNPVFILDQFEEVFTSTPADLRERFLAQLAGLLESDAPVTIILTLRDDFYSSFTRQSAALTRWLERGQVNVEATLSRDDLREMISAPAEMVGLGFEPGLVETLLDDVTGSKNEGPSNLLPLLEFALTQIWERRVDGLLTHSAYQKLGGVTGGLASWADRAYRAIPAEQRELVQHIFTSLVNLGDEKQNLPHTRRRMAIADLVPQAVSAADVQNIVKSLADARLLATHGEEVEITHEILLRSWPQFIRWLEENRASLQLRESVRENALEWEAHQREESFLDHRGTRLDEALAQSPQLNPLERAYLQACQSLREKEHLARQRRIRLTLAGVGAALLILVTILAGWGVTSSQNAKNLSLQVSTARAAVSTSEYSQEQERAQAATAVAAQATAVGEANFRATAQAESEAQTKLARGGELAVQSILLRDSKLDVALLVSVEAFRAAETSQTKNVLLENTQVNPQLIHFFHLDQNVVCVGFSPDLKLFVAGNNDGTLTVWDMESYQVVGQPIGGTAAPNKIAFSPNGKTIAVAYADGALVLWDLNTRQPLGRGMIEGQAGGRSLAFSPDGKTLAVGNQDGLIMFWEVATMKSTGQVNQGSSASLVFSPDGKTLAAGGRKPKLWDLSTFQLISRIPSDVPGVSQLAFSSDGRFLAAGGSYSSIELFDLSQNPPGYSGFPVPDNEEGQGTIFSVAFSPVDSSTLVSGGTGNTVILWYPFSGKMIGQPLRGHTAAVTLVSFSTDGTKFASYGEDKTVILWEGNLHQPLVRPLEVDEAVRSLTFVPNGKILATSSDGQTIFSWDVTTQQPVARQVALPADLFSGMNVSPEMTFSPDGKTLATVTQNDITLFDLAASRAIGHLLTKNSASPSRLAFSPDGKILASGFEDGSLSLWDVATQQPLGQPLVKQTGAITNLVFSPDGKFLASDDGNTIVIWESLASQPTGQPLEGATSYSDYLTFSPDGKTLVADFGDVINIWDTATRKNIDQIKLPDNNGSISNLAFNSDGTILSSTVLSRNGVFKGVFLWDLATRQVITELFVEPRVETLKFSPDRMLFATHDGFGTVLLWNLETSFLVEQTCQRAGRNFTRAEWAQYFPGEEYRATCPQWPLEAEPTVTPTP